MTAWPLGLLTPPYRDCFKVDFNNRGELKTRNMCLTFEMRALRREVFWNLKSSTGNLKSSTALFVLQFARHFTPGPRPKSESIPSVCFYGRPQQPREGLHEMPGRPPVLIGVVLLQLLACECFIFRAPTCHSGRVLQPLCFPIFPLSLMSSVVRWQNQGRFALGTVCPVCVHQPCRTSVLCEIRGVISLCCCHFWGLPMHIVSLSFQNNPSIDSIDYLLFSKQIDRCVLSATLSCHCALWAPGLLLSSCNTFLLHVVLQTLFHILVNMHCK